MGLGMATAAKTVYSHITKEAGVRGGRACIDQTRVAVMDIAAMLKRGQSAQEMLLAYPSLNLAQVHAAISYYYENTGEIEAELAEDEGWEAEHERQKSEHLARGPAK
jgi:uncharacterized protein (DUF433 family)